MMIPVVIIVLFILFIVIVTNVRVVPQSRACIIERLGAYHTTWQVGFHVKFPFIDRIANSMSLKEKVMDFPPQPVITKDNVTIQIDTVVYCQVTDPKLYTYGVENPNFALENLTSTTIRNIIGELELDETLTSRDVINTKMRSILDEATDPWGIKVTRVEVKNIDPPKAIQEAMEKQMRAERERREKILVAEGQKQSEILVAEGKKQARILDAEAQKQAAILQAEAEKEAKIRKAEGEAAAEAAVLDTAYTAESTRKIIAARDKCRAALLAAGIPALPSATNFLFVRADAADAAPVQQSLRAEGILVRHFAAPRLKPWLRVTVGTEEDMEKVTEALIRLIRREGGS